MQKNLTCCAAVLALTYAAPLTASPLDDAIRAEVLPGWILADGQRQSALRLTLAPGWKTYWRAPGDAGIPPSFDWRKTRNASGISVSWPTPNVFYEYGIRSLGYKGEVILPLTITQKNPGQPIKLRGEISLGICSDICVPHRVEINATLPPAASQPSPEIVAAMASLPYSAAEAEVRSTVCRISPTADGMEIQAQVDLPHTGGDEVTVIETGVPGVWVSEPTTARHGNTLTATSVMMHTDGDAFSINRSNVRITIIGSDYAVDVKGCTGS